MERDNNKLLEDQKSQLSKLYNQYKQENDKYKESMMNHEKLI